LGHLKGEYRHSFCAVFEHGVIIAKTIVNATVVLVGKIVCYIFRHINANCCTF